jgi:TnpA family transposase
MTAISILNENEIIKFDSPPELSVEQRKIYFSNKDLIENHIKLRKDISKVGFILQFGYFNRNKKFFVPNQFHQKDIDFVCSLMGLQSSIDIAEYKKSSYTIHRKLILEIHSFHSYTDFKDLVKKESIALVKTALRPKDIFFSLLDFLFERNIEIPKYYIFADLITKALNNFESDLINQTSQMLTEQQKELLDQLLILPSNSDKVSAKKPYLITTLKKPSQVITPKKIKESLNDFLIIKELHLKFSTILDSTGISKELLNYYAIWVVKAEHVQYDSISSVPMKRLYLMAFIAYQFRLRQDLFVDTFIQCVQRYFNETDKIVAKNFLNPQKNQKSLKRGHLSKLRNIVTSSKQQLERVKEILYAERILDSEKLLQIKALFIENKGSYHDDLLEELSRLESFNINRVKDQMHYTELSNGYRRVQNRISGILKYLEFNVSNSNHHIVDGILNYQSNNGKISNDSPVGFISEKDLKWMYNSKGNLDYNLYKVILFKEVSNHIKAGSLNLKYSDKYKSIDEYLINDEYWSMNKQSLIERANISKLKNFSEFINASKSQLSKQYETTNSNIRNNKFIKFNNEGKAIVKTPRLEKSQTNGCIDILGKDQYLPLINILSDIRHSTDLSKAFTHYSRKTVKKQLADDLIYAALIGLGCNIGVRKMGKISKGIGANKLDYTVRWYFSKQNLDEANRRILHVINNLSLPKIYNKNKNELHTSSDGQKFSVGVPSLHSRYSYKYFGFGKGVSAYSFIDEQNKLFYSTIISTSEREAGYVLDGLMHNEEIESNIHSTDTHGYSEIIFAVCNSLDILFAPRIKNYKNQLLYTFKDENRKSYLKKNYRILPSKNMYIDEIIIAQQWDNILKLLCSIKLKESKASEILGRLSTYSKQHPLYKALKELGRIHKTIFLLRYLSETPLRQEIEKQLNKVELSHQFAKAVFFGNNQEFKVGTKEEQEIALACRHVIQNAIILWNYLFISDKISKSKTKEEYSKILEQLKYSSVMTWQHINLHGEYDFEVSKKSFGFDMKTILALEVE